MKQILSLLMIVLASCIVGCSPNLDKIEEKIDKQLTEKIKQYKDSDEYNLSDLQELSVEINNESNEKYYNVLIKISERYHDDLLDDKDFGLTKDTQVINEEYNILVDKSIDLRDIDLIKLKDSDDIKFATYYETNTEHEYYYILENMDIGIDYKNNPDYEKIPMYGNTPRFNRGRQRYKNFADNIEIDIFKVDDLIREFFYCNLFETQ